MSTIQRCNNNRNWFIIAIIMRCVRYSDCWNTLFDLRKCLCNALVQLLRSLHINQQSHMIFIHLIRIVEQNECISTLQKLSKSIHYRNSFETFKLSSLQNVSLKTQLFAMFAAFQCDFDHNSIRTRSIFDIVDFLNKVHFELQNELSFIYFTYWMQMLLRCEIAEIAKQLRNVDFRNLIRCKSNSEVVRKNFF